MLLSFGIIKMTSVIVWVQQVVTRKVLLVGGHQFVFQVLVRAGRAHVNFEIRFFLVEMQDSFVANLGCQSDLLAFFRFVKTIAITTNCC